MGKLSDDKHEFHGRDRWLLVSAFAGPVAVLSNLTVNYSLVPTACASGSKWMLHVVTLVFAIVVAAAGALSWKSLREFAGEPEVLWQERTRWVATVGVVLAIASLFVLVAMEIPNVILRSCD